MTPDLPDPTEPERSRWTDVPFSFVRDSSGRIVERAGLPDLTDAECETIEARNLAWQVYNTTGDDSELRRLGVLPLLDGHESEHG
jgi:hypothetical protein